MRACFPMLDVGFVVVGDLPKLRDRLCSDLSVQPLHASKGPSAVGRCGLFLRLLKSDVVLTGRLRQYMWTACVIAEID